MSTVLALGELDRIEGFALAGASVVAAETADLVRDVWRSLAPDVGLVILTPAASAALGARRWERDDVLTVVVR